MSGWVAKRRLVKKLRLQCNSFESQDGEIIHRDYKKTLLGGALYTDLSSERFGIPHAPLPYFSFSGSPSLKC